MFAKIAYKQNINMWKTNISLQHLKFILGIKLFFRRKRFLQIIFKYIFSFILEFRSLKFPELESWEPEVPGTWELRNLGTSELGNLGTCLRVSLFFVF